MEYSCFEYPLNNTIRLIFLFCYWRVRSICPLVQAGCSCWQMISQFLRGIWQLLLMSLVSALQFSGFTLPRLNPCCFFAISYEKTVAKQNHVGVEFWVSQIGHGFDPLPKLTSQGQRSQKHRALVYCVRQSDGQFELVRSASHVHD